MVYNTRYLLEKLGLGDVSFPNTEKIRSGVIICLAAMKDIKQIIEENVVVVFSKTYCPYCVRVKQLLTKLKAKFKAIELDHDPEGAAMQQALAQMTGQRTVPSVFINKQHIGGCDNTEALNRQGKLVPLLEAAGAV